MPKKKTVSNSNTSGALTKEDLVNYMGPVFEELKSEIGTVESRLGSRIDSVESRLGSRIDSVESRLGSRIDSVDSQLKSKIDTVESRLTDKINWQGTLMEQMNKKFDVALELTEMTHSNNITLNEHSTKIESLEKDVRILKTV